VHRAGRFLWSKVAIPAVAALAVGIGTGIGGAFLPDDPPSVQVGQTAGEAASVAAEVVFDATASPASAGGGCKAGQVYDQQAKQCVDKPDDDPIPDPTPRAGADGQDGEDGKDGTDGKDGQDGEDGKSVTPEPDVEATPETTPEAAPLESMVSSGTLFSPTTGKPLFIWTEGRNGAQVGDAEGELRVYQEAITICDEAIEKQGVDYTGQEVIDLCRAAFETAARLVPQG